MHSVPSNTLLLNEQPVPAFLQSLKRTLMGRLLIGVAATALIAAAAHISLRLPFTPVPITMSDFAVLLIGLAFGPTAAFSVLVLYLGEGAVGLPVFNPDGVGGLAQLMGPTAGYLFAYPFAAALAGMALPLRRSGMSNFTAAVIASTAATALIFASGAVWISHLRYLSASSVWSIAVGPFLFGAAIKIVAAGMIFASTRRWFTS